MRHVGDITKINGAELEPVDCITGGSPCQDLSVAGKRAGLAGKRSGLFMEQIRVIKEMREADVRRGRSGFMVRPRYMVWENVPGAFSSNGGKDFAAVLEETIRVAEPEAPDVPVPDKGWSKAGCIYDPMGSWSVAWRVHDAQFWGVSQRRKRICLVADFGGLSAPEILFERKGMSRDPQQSITERQGTAGGSENRAGEPITYPGVGITSLRNGNNPKPGDPCHSLTEDSRNYLIFCLQGNGIDRADTAGCNGRGWCENVSYTLNTIDRPAVCAGFAYKAAAAAAAGSIGYQEELSPTLKAEQQMAVYDAICIGNGQTNQSIDTVVGALNCMHDPQAVFVPDVAHTLKAKANLQFREDSETYIAAVDCRNGVENTGVNGILQAKEQGMNLNSNKVCRIGSVVRRLTPLECERLQGYPDGWTDIGDWVDSKGKKHKGDADSPRYKALGNSIALPFWFYILRRISAQYERPATLGSLFDGIGGFPLCWERCNGTGTARWASEIEEFPMAVTKLRFPEED